MISMFQMHLKKKRVILSCASSWTSQLLWHWSLQWVWLAFAYTTSFHCVPSDCISHLISVINECSSSCTFRYANTTTMLIHINWSLYMYIVHDFSNNQCALDAFFWLIHMYMYVHVHNMCYMCYMEDYNKWPLVFERRPLQKPRGCFGRSRKRIEHASLDYMKRWIINSWLVLVLQCFGFWQVFPVCWITSVMSLQRYM